MTEGKFYPALHLGEFDDGRAALHSVGLNGQLADLIIAGMGDMPGEPVAYQAILNGEEYADHAQTMLVLLPLRENRIGLYLGFFGLLADSRHDALMMAVAGIVDGAREGRFEEPPTFDAFQWRQPRGVLQ